MTIIGDPVKTTITYVAVGVSLFLALALAGTGYSLEKAKKREAQAVAQLNKLKTDTANAAVISVNHARSKERVAQQNQDEVVNDLRQKLSDYDGRVVSLLRRVRLAERAGANGSGHTKAPYTSEGSGGLSGSGLRNLDGGNLVLTEASQESLARFAVSAKDTGETLKACQRLLLGAEALTSD